jgi:hypothetical protein
MNHMVASKRCYALQLTYKKKTNLRSRTQTTVMYEKDGSLERTPKDFYLHNGVLDKYPFTRGAPLVTGSASRSGDNSS